jgi:curved DNA-binding protein CbpA
MSPAASPVKSAYLVLGVPMHATPEEVRAAYMRKIKIVQRQEELSGPLAVAARHAEIKVAYEILCDEDQRAAHDIALNRAGSAEAPASGTARHKMPPHSVLPPPPETSPLRWVIITAVVLVVGGLWLNYQRVERLRVQAETEAAAAAVAQQKEQAEAHAQEVRQQEENRLRELALKDAERKASYQERQLRRDMEQAGQRAQMTEYYRQAQENQRASMELQEARRLENEARMNEQRRQMEAQRIMEADRRQIRALCIQNYGRPNC